jgi:hypothetical protein
MELQPLNSHVSYHAWFAEPRAIAHKFATCVLFSTSPDSSRASTTPDPQAATPPRHQPTHTSPLHPVRRSLQLQP